MLRLKMSNSAYQGMHEWKPKFSTECRLPGRIRDVTTKEFCTRLPRQSWNGFIRSILLVYDSLHGEELTRESFQMKSHTKAKGSIVLLLPSCQAPLNATHAPQLKPRRFTNRDWPLMPQQNFKVPGETLLHPTEGPAVGSPAEDRMPNCNPNSVCKPAVGDNLESNRQYSSPNSDDRPPSL